MLTQTPSRETQKSGLVKAVFGNIDIGASPEHEIYVQLVGARKVINQISHGRTAVIKDYEKAMAVLKLTADRKKYRIPLDALKTTLEQLDRLYPSYQDVSC